MEPELSGGDVSDQTLERVRQAVERGSTRSPLYRWLWRNHDEFAALVSVGRPSWSAVAAELDELGYRNGVGGKLTGETVRQTWLRVRARWAKVNSAKATWAKRNDAPALPPVVRPVSSGAPLPRPVVGLTRLAGSTREDG